MRTVLTLAALAVTTVFAGCAVIVVPDDASGNVHVSSVFGSNAVQGNGQAASERREAGSASVLDISGPLQTEVRVGAAPSLQIEGDSNLLPMVRTEAVGDTLRVYVDGSIRANLPLRVIYTTPRLSQVNANGSGRLSVSGLQGGALTLNKNGSGSARFSGNVSSFDARLNGSGSVDALGLEAGSTLASLNGSGRLSLGGLRGDRLNLDVHGSGGVNASGQVRALSVRLYGSGSADLAGLSSQTAELSTHGSGSISAAVSQSLVADTSGSGHVTVYGNPAQRSISGKHVSVMQ